MSLANWNAKVAANTPRLRIMCLGASITEGYFPMSTYFERWAELLGVNANILRGDGVRYDGYIAAHYGPSLTSPITRAGSVTAQYVYGAGLKNVYVGAGGSLSWSGGGLVHSFDVFYTKSLIGGTFNVSVDGTSLGNVNTTALTNQGSHKRSFTMPTTGPQNLVISPTIGLASSWIEGVTIYSHPTRGVVITNSGHGGYMAANYNSSPYTPHFLAGHNPDVVVMFDLGCNERFQDPGRTIAQFKADMATTVSLIRANTSADILLCIPHEFPSMNPNVEPWADWQAAYMDIAATHGLELLDVGSSLGNFMTYGANPYDSGDQVHPNAAGHALIESLIRNTLF